MTPFLQLALAARDACSLGGDCRGAVARLRALCDDALDRLDRRDAAAAESEGEPPADEVPAPPASRWQSLADEWGESLLVLRSVDSHIDGRRDCVEYVVRAAGATPWERANAREEVAPR